MWDIYCFTWTGFCGLCSRWCIPASLWSSSPFTSPWWLYTKLCRIFTVLLGLVFVGFAPNGVSPLAFGVAAPSLAPGDFFLGENSTDDILLGDGFLGDFFWKSFIGVHASFNLNIASKQHYHCFNVLIRHVKSINQWNQTQFSLDMQEGSITSAFVMVFYLNSIFDLCFHVYIYLVRIPWKLSQAPANVIFCVYRWFHLNFFEQLPLVEQYHAINISSTCFFRGDFLANVCSSDISNCFEWLYPSDLREIYICMCLGKFSENPDLVYNMPLHQEDTFFYSSYLIFYRGIWYNGFAFLRSVCCWSFCLEC